MEKVDKSMESEFKIIHKEHERNHIDTMQMIRALGNTLLNLQQIFAQKYVEIDINNISLDLNQSLSSSNYIS